MKDLIIDGLNFSYSNDSNIIFHGLCLCGDLGDRICILGENGTGKSTFLKIVSNIIPCKLNISFLDKSYTSFKEIISHIGYVPDKPFLYNELSGIENINFIKSVFQEDKKIYINNVKKICYKFGIANDLDTRVKNYSLGMSNKLFLAAILARNVDIILLDEPLNAFDEQSQQCAAEEILELSGKGKIIIFTSHNPYFQKHMANKLYKIARNKLEEVKV